MVSRLSGWTTVLVALALVVGCDRSGGGSSGGSSATGSPTSVDSADKWAEHTQQLPFVVGYEKGLAEAKAQNKPAMLFVTTTWCGYCTKLAHENFTDTEIKSLLGNFVLVIVDGDTEPDALSALNSTEGFPHIIFQSASGERLSEQLGYAPVADFKKVIQEALDNSDQA